LKVRHEPLCDKAGTAGRKFQERNSQSRITHATKTYLSGDGIFWSDVSFLILSLLSLLFMLAAGQFDAAEASVEREGSWIEALLPWRC
jgi:hypothetical protein